MIRKLFGIGKILRFDFLNDFKHGVENSVEITFSTLLIVDSDLAFVLDVLDDVVYKIFEV